MADLNNFKNRLKIAKKKLKRHSNNLNNNENSTFMGSAFK